MAPIEARDFILENGIFTPRKVNELIDAGTLPREVLGVSYGNNTSNFPDYVSLLTDENKIKLVAQEISKGRTGHYYSNSLLAISYQIDEEIVSHGKFLDVEEVKRMGEFWGCDSFPSEVLYYGDIPRKFIKTFCAARTS